MLIDLLTVVEAHHCVIHIRQSQPRSMRKVVVLGIPVVVNFGCNVFGELPCHLHFIFAGERKVGAHLQRRFILIALNKRSIVEQRPVVAGLFLLPKLR